jgi:CPA1 family monovalent cation:H+ antiporter
MLEITVWCLVITAVFAYINHRFIGLPTTIGVMSVALAISGALIGLDYLGWSAPRRYQAAMVASIDFSGVLMRGMLAVLLFAGGLQCWRRSKFDPPCRLNFDPGLGTGIR